MEIFIFATVLFIVFIVTISWHTLKSFRHSIYYQVVTEDNHWIKLGQYLFLLVAPILGFIRYQVFETSGEIVFAKAHLPTLITMATIGGVSFWISKFFKKTTTPWLNILLPIGILQGILLNIVLAIHFGRYILLGTAYPMHGFELVAPLFNVLFLSRELYHNHLNFSQRFKKEPIASSNYIVLILYILMDRSFLYKLRLFMMLLAPAVVAQVMVLLFAGQSPDAILQVFTDTKGFTFSNPGKNTLELITDLIR